MILVLNNFDDFTLFKTNAEARTITNTNDSNIDKHIKSIKEIFIDKVNKTIKNNIQIFNILDKNEVNINKKINIYTEKHISPYYISSSDEYCYNNCEVLDKMKYNIDSSLGDSNYGSIKTQDECFKICTNNPECKQAVYNKTEKKCYSMKNITQEDPNKFVRQVYLTYNIKKDTTDSTNSKISFELLESLKGSVSDSSIKAGDFISFSVNLTNNDDNTIIIKEGTAFKVKASTIASQNVLLSKINITSDLELNSQNIDLSKYDLMTQIGNTNTKIKLLKYPTKLSGGLLLGTSEEDKLLKLLNSKYFKNYIFYDDYPNRDSSKGFKLYKRKCNR